MPIDERLHEFQLDPAHTASHSFASDPVPLGAITGPRPAITLICPLASTTTSRTSTPAATTPLTARVTSPCLNLDGALAIGQLRSVDFIDSFRFGQGATCGVVFDELGGHRRFPSSSRSSQARMAR